MQAGLREGIYPSPFLNDVDTFTLPESPDFLVTGDFNADGNQDVVAAARGGQAFYLFAGDGHGGLSGAQRISVPGSITAMTKGHFNEEGGLTTLALGIAGADGARLLVYDAAGKGVHGQADTFPLRAEANAITTANVDGDSAGDLIVGAGNQVVVIHGRNQAEPAANQNIIERFDVPCDITAVSAGDFLFDREGKTKLALLSSDGTIHFLAPGALDTRPFTRAEIQLMQKQRLAIRHGEADEASLPRLIQSMVHRSGAGDSWQEKESRSTGAIPLGANPQALLTKTADAGALLDQLLVLEPAGNKVQLVDFNSQLKPASLRQPEGTSAIDAVDVEATPIAAVTMRLSVDGRPGMVLLQSNHSDPGLLIPAANIWNVTSNADAVDDNPGNGVCHTAGNVCTLRAAMMESSYFGGSNTINLQSATYTLSLNGISGGADDEFDGLGDDQTGGDLDLVDLNSICTFLGGGNPATGCPGVTLGGTALTSVTINGNGIANTTITMGVLANLCGTTKDRLLDVNPGADPQFPTDVIISGLTMQGGNAPFWDTSNSPTCNGVNHFHEDGGAIQFDGTKSQNPLAGPTATLTLTTVKINSNTSSGQGGGVFINFGSGLIQTNSLVTLNTTTLGSGGGISYNGGNTNLSQTLTISGSTIGGVGGANNAPDTTFGNGGGLNTNGGTGITINSSAIISNNIAGNRGGGIAFSNSPVIAISSSTISNNTAKTDGGGIWCSARNAVTNAASTATLTTATVTGNTADSDNNGTGNGGGIYNLFGSLIVQTTSHIDGNAAINGGGIYSTWNSQALDASASLSVNGGTVGQTGSGNTAKNNGGGVMISPTGATTFGTYSITGTTIQANTANSDSSGGGDGGGIYIDSGSLNTLNNAIIDTNVANSGTGDGIFMNGGSITAAGTLTLSGDDSLNINAGTFTSTAGIFSLAGNFTRASGGTFTHNSGTLNFNGGAGQSINGTTATTFNNLTNSNGNGLSMTNDNTVNGVLALTSSDITVANTKTLTLASTTASTGTFDVVGSVKRNTPSPLSSAVGYTFGNPNNVITFTAAGTRPTDLTINLVKAAPSGAIGFPNAVNRTYTITPTGGVGFSATVRLHYLASELNGNTEGAGLNLWRFNGVGWAPIGQTANSTAAPNNWVEKSGVTAFSPWTFNSTLSPTASNGSLGGRITDGNGAPVAGAVINLSGAQSRKTITDANGNYQFDNIDTGGFYTVTPARANYNFNPGNRSFSQVGNQTEAAFTGIGSVDNANPLDTPEYFVRQQYVDVMGREPEEGGFNYWSDQILACGDDATCVNARRRDVAAAFFIADEFQASGSYIYDVYAGALGRRPVFSEYSVDRQQVVGGATLDAAKTVFAQNFVQRAEFMTKYQSAMTAESFVDALIQSVQASGVNLSGDRDSLIAAYNGGSGLDASRAAVVKTLADNATFKQSQYNQAFVLTEYFAYLRRDAEPDGYNFWVNVLNTGDPGNYRGMVCSFVTSAEYQNRFSSVVSHTNGECGQ